MSAFPTSARDPVDTVDEPFPLRSRFRRRFLPLFGVLLALVSAVVAVAASRVMQSIYLDIAARRAAVIDRAMTEHRPAPWAALVRTRDPLRFAATADGASASSAVADEARELGLAHLKIYDARGITLFSLDPGEIGAREDNDLFRQASAGMPGVSQKDLADGTRVYELYIPATVDRGRVGVVFELYEPVGDLDDALVTASASAFAVFFTVLAAIAFGLDRLVARAQRDIDGRTALLTAFRERLERFVSGHAVDAARLSLRTGEMRSERIACTLFYSDVRSFTSFSETHEPDAVVRFLNRIVGLQVAAIRRQDGDVDKLIGDAVLAHFHGPGREARALAAAEEAQRAVAAADLARGIGIGVFSGEVVSGAVGPAERMDFTVIGDSVNVSARLCSAAGAGETVADVATVAAARAGGFGAPETITVKGRVQPLSVRRWRADRATVDRDGLASDGL
jgi:adenylate cyclase